MSLSQPVDRTDAELDSQQVEILGRNIVKGSLIEADLEVATPERDNGIDLIVFRWGLAGEFVAKPIQIKAASKFSFGMDKKYEKIPGLIMVFVMNCRTPQRSIYAMTYGEMVSLGTGMGWTETNSWNVGGGYSTRHPSPKLMGFLAPFCISAPEQWQRLLETSPTA